MKGFLRAAVLIFALAEAASAVPVELSGFSPSAITVNFDLRPDASAIPGIVVPPYSGTISGASVIDDDYQSVGVVFSSVDSGPVAVEDPVAVKDPMGVEDPVAG